MNISLAKCSNGVVNAATALLSFRIFVDGRNNSFPIWIVAGANIAAETTMELIKLKSSGDSCEELLASHSTAQTTELSDTTTITTSTIYKKNTIG